MPRANRCFLPGQVWHITHRCHEKAFLLKFGRDRQRYLRWVFEAKKRFGLCVLNYAVTSNHVHLLVKDRTKDAIAKSMQLIAGRTAQEFNLRKRRHGAFWEDRYHATAIETGEHLRRCVVYIDLNMMRAGVVRHPADWPHGGYRDIHDPPQRYALIDLVELSESCGFERIENFQCNHRQWIETALAQEALRRDGRWSESLAVGSEMFVEDFKNGLGYRANSRSVIADEDHCVLREDRTAYRREFNQKNDALSSETRIIASGKSTNAKA